MTLLQLPEQLKGPWDHALILTYGLDVPFFERTLWRQFAARCRNKILLADGRHYLQKCVDHAQDRRVNYMNQSYVAGGIFAPRAAYAKLILLTNSEQGRLLVGSGNLNWQGYASGGELFTQYEYKVDAPDSLAAFLAVRELLEGMIKRGYLDPIAESRITLLCEQTSWLYYIAPSTERPVRHNLTQSFLNQLQEVIGGNEVEELWVATPFYDKEVAALERLLMTFQPRQTTLLIQPERTSVDPDALQQVLGRVAGLCTVRPFRMRDVDAYVHAKLFLFKLANRAICLQGSPNLSQVAMLLPASPGNIEVANLLSGPRNAFDDLLDAFIIDPPSTGISALKVSYQGSDMAGQSTTPAWYLISGEWLGEQLVLSFRGRLPDLQNGALLIRGQEFALNLSYHTGQQLELRLNAEAAAQLGRPVPLAIRWNDGTTVQQSNPIFVCNKAALTAVLDASAEGEHLAHVGDLDLEDKEFEELLGELERTLVFDRHSAWQLAGRTTTSNSLDDDQTDIAYPDIDYDLLRQHPKIQQYLNRSGGSKGYARSRLQIILSSITAHFDGLVEDMRAGHLSTGQLTELMELEDDEEAVIQEVQDRQKRHWSAQQRIERILTNFIRRYLQGIQSPEFQKWAGPEVMAQNYVIFTHILWRLFAKDWVSHQFIIDKLLETWHFFWGRGARPGYVSNISIDEQIQLGQWIEEYHNDAETLAALCYSYDLVWSQNGVEQSLALRDVWREFLLNPLFAFTAKLLEDTWQVLRHLLPYDPPTPTAIVELLTELARFDTRGSFLRKIEATHQFPQGSCTFQRQVVLRHGRSVPVECLVIQTPNALANKGEALALLYDWMYFEDLDYYRISVPRGSSSVRLIYYDLLDQAGVYLARDLGGEIQDLGQIRPKATAWEASLTTLTILAKQLEAGGNYSALANVKTVL